MVDALVGAVIALIATGGVALLAETLTAAKLAGRDALTPYEVSVVEVVRRAHADAAGSAPPGSDDAAVLTWLKSTAANPP